MARVTARVLRSVLLVWGGREGGRKEGATAVMRRFNANESCLGHNVLALSLDVAGLSRPGWTME